MRAQPSFILNLCLVTLILMAGGTDSRAAPEPKAPKPDLTRSKVGSVFSAPVAHGENLYFVSTTGVLYEADSEMKKIKKLFEGKKQSTGAITLSGDTLYWGEGLHGDTSTELHSYDLKKKKIGPSFKVTGHVERPVLASGGSLYVPMGPGGIARLDSETAKGKATGSYKETWRTSQHGAKPLHIDSNLVEYQSEVCAASVYETKGLICFDKATGKETRFHELKRDPKGQLGTSNDLIYGFATSGNLLEPKFDIPSDFYVVDLKEKKLRFEKELRGFNFFAPPVEKNEAFLTLSTGDFILLNLVTQKITFLGEFPEPFINPPFRMNEDYCGIGIMGKFNCYTKTQDMSPAVSKDSRILETVIGEVSVLNSRVYLPTRIGFSVQ